MNRIYFYIGAALSLLCAVAFGLAFSPLRIYSLISSIVLGIAALSMVAAQQKKEKFKALFYLKIADYILLAAGVILFVSGMIYSALV